MAVGTTAMPKPKKKKPAADHPTQAWKQPVEALEEYDILSDWAELHRQLDEEREGRWRPMGEI